MFFCVLFVDFTRIIRRVFLFCTYAPAECESKFARTIHLLHLVRRSTRVIPAFAHVQLLHTIRFAILIACISQSIMLKFIDNQDPILPVHDSFLVHNGYESALEQYMRDFFEDRFNREIDVKKQIKMEKPLPEFDPENPFGHDVTMDLRVLLAALEVGHQRRLEKFRAL